MPAQNEIELPPPYLIGAPGKYTQWRHLQAEAVLAAADSKKRFIIQGAPTGFGKSLVYISQALLTGSRTIILTATKALQSQLMFDFEESGLVEIKGLNSYECIEGRPAGRFGDMRREGFRVEHGLPMMCDEAPCQVGIFCPKREGGCLYYDAYRKASSLNSKLVIANYAYWMSINKFNEDGLGKFDLLILDEAHNAVDELGGFIGTELRPSEVETVLPGEARVLSPGADQIDWKAWGDHWLATVVNELEAIKAAIKEAEHGGHKVGFNVLRRARDLKRLQHKLSTIAGMSGDWIIDYTEDHQGRPLAKFDPVWPGEYAEDNLFLDIPKVVMVSATVRPKTAEMLGIRPAQIDFKEYPSTFPKQNRPIIFVPTAAMNQRSASAGMRDMCSRTDQIISRRLDRKALIQTVSYKRAREIYMGSEHKGMMLMHDSTNTREVIARFKQSKEPLILVSPVLDTGYDFPYCVGPDTRILTADLRWVPAGDISIGDQLAAFDENPNMDGPGATRKWRTTTVLNNEVISRPRYRLTFSNGTVVVCSSDHKWLVQRDGVGNKWVTTEMLRAGAPQEHYTPAQAGKAPSRVCEIMDVWDTRSDYDAGYMAAALDGEGCLHINSQRTEGKSFVKMLSFFQRDNGMLHHMERLLTSSEFRFSHAIRRTTHQDGHALQVLNHRDIARFLGQMRPIRLLPKWNWCGSVKSRTAYLIEKEKLGTGLVCALETDARTYVAEGLASHNCQAEYQIIVKVPFPVTVDKILKARMARDKHYRDYLTMVTIVQMAGRICRAEDDQGETFILDSDFGWWYYGIGHKLAPHWFNEAVRQEQMLGMPLTKLD